MGYNLYEAVDACSHLLEGFGGHMYAAGLTLKEENLEKFTECFEKYVAETITDEQLVPQIIVDSIVDLDEIDEKFYRILKQFAPFGPDNMRPVFVSRDVKDTGYSKVVGKDETHLKISVKQNSKIFNGIAFGMADKYKLISDKTPFDICFNIDENNFMGKTSLQLSVKDIKKD
jgi:single-stranded-DNA-specific exonuclease